MRTLRELAREALAVQNACNSLGISKSFATSLQELSDRLRADGLPADTAAICRHPIHRLWASKVHDLAGMGLSDLSLYAEALGECQRLAAA